MKTNTKALITILVFALLGASLIRTAYFSYLTELSNNRNLLIVYARPAGKLTTITAYTSRPEETDSSPCISADNTNICDFPYQVCAANAYPFGSLLYIESLGMCQVRDRTNKKYADIIDWYMKQDLTAALKFGKQQLLVHELFIP